MSEFNFEGEIQEANWALLADHHKREAVYLVSSRQDLSFVGERIAKDDVAQVKKWLQSKDLRKPEANEVETWQNEMGAKIFRFLIVSPYVLIQLKESANN